MQKKIILLSTVLAMGLTLTACGTKSDQGVRPNALNQPNGYNPYATQKFSVGGHYNSLGDNQDPYGANPYALYNQKGTGMRSNTLGNGNATGINGTGNQAGVMNGNNNQIRGYGNDGFLGFTNTNPNLFHNGQFLSGNYHYDANRISRAAASVPGVNNTNVVISGGTVYIGLDITGIQNHEQARTIENRVRKKVESMVPRYRIYIASDHSTYGKLRSIGNAVTNGKPIAEFRRDLDGISERMQQGR